MENDTLQGVHAKESEPAAVPVTESSADGSVVTPSSPIHSRGHRQARKFLLLASLSGFLFGVLGSVLVLVLATRWPILGIRPYSNEKPVSSIPGQGPDTSSTMPVLNAGDEQIVQTVEKSSPSVVSIVISKDVPRLRQITPFGLPFISPFFDNGSGIDTAPDDPGTGSGGNTGGNNKQTIGAGSGFFVSTDGLIATNKHVVSDDGASYTVITSDGKEHPAEVVARDPARDLAVIRLTDKSTYPALPLGNSDMLQIGQTAIAIGNSLGEFSNTVSKGIISGLQRDITAGSGLGGGTEQLANIIQTDAAINPGNSGGPLLDASGQVIGINVAVAQGAQNIGFALPINQVQRIISQVQKTGKITVPFLGVRYVYITPDIAKNNGIGIDHGALILRGDMRTDLAVVPGSPADKAGIVENDVILAVNGKTVDATHPLNDLLADFNPGDTVALSIWHKGSTQDIQVKLEERK